MGVTVLYSSGDSGVAGNGNLCLNPDGSQTASGKIFNPSFPSTCPYVTSVGATQGIDIFSTDFGDVFIICFTVNPGSTVFQPESACEQVIYSGGGFSNHFAVPDYQKDAVKSYLKNHPPAYSKKIFNSTGMSRGFPDLSANGANYVISVSHSYCPSVAVPFVYAYAPNSSTAIFHSYLAHLRLHQLLEPS